MENKITQLENEIRHFIHSDNGCEVKFILRGNENNHQIDTFTINPITQETFLLKQSINHNSSEECLEEILEYVKSQKELDSFTIIWNKKESNELTKQSSYFYCHDIQDAINKFFTGKDVKDYIIYEVKMNARA